MLRRKNKKRPAPAPFVPFLQPDRQALPASAWGAEAAKVAAR